MVINNCVVLLNIAFFINYSILILYCLSAVTCTPEMFMSVNVSSKSISFTWRSPLKSNGIILKYILQCTDMSNKLHLQLNGSQTTTTLSGLHPFTNYSCSITAHTSVRGGPAATTSVVTEQDSKFSFINT